MALKSFVCIICGTTFERERKTGGQPPKVCGPECHAERARINARGWHSDNPDRVRDRNISKHGLTVEQYDALVRAQHGRCAICGSSDARAIRIGRWSIDHDHACCPGPHSCGNCIRGLLCSPCNRGLGQFDDRPELLDAAADYLRRPRLML